MIWISDGFAQQVQIVQHFALICRIVNVLKKRRATVITVKKVSLIIQMHD